MTEPFFLFIERRGNEFVWSASFFVWASELGHWTWRRAGGFAPTNLAALDEASKFGKEVDF